MSRLYHRSFFALAVLSICNSAKLDKLEGMVTERTTPHVGSNNQPAWLCELIGDAARRKQSRNPIIKTDPPGFNCTYWF